MKNQNHIQPPKWPLAVLRFFMKKEFLEEIEGDMEEIYQDYLDKHSRKKAGRLYALETLKLLRPNLLGRIRVLSRFNNYLLLKHYFKVGWRSIKKDKVSAMINISGLTIALTVFLVLSVFVKYESNFDSHHALANRTFRVVQHTHYPEEELYWNTTAYPLAAALREDFHNIELVTQTAGPFDRVFSIDAEKGERHLFESDYVLFVDSYYPQVFDLNWIHGDPTTALGEFGNVVLTESLAKRYFGETSNALGKQMMLNAKDPLVVTGVVKDAPGNSNLRYEILIPYQFFKHHNNYFANNWSGNYQGTTFVVLPENGSEAEIETAFVTWKKKYLSTDDDQRIDYFLQPLKSAHTQTLYGSSPGSYMVPRTILNAAVFVAAFILLIAVVNFVNLVTARAGMRSREVGIRKAIGSSRANLIKQFILENVILVLITICLSVLATQLVLDSLNKSLTIINLQLVLTWDEAMLVLTAGVLTIIFSTIYPAVVLSSYQPIKALRNEITLKGTRLRKSLTLFQFSIVQVFIIASIIVGSQMQFFKDKDLGFSSDAVLIAPIPRFEKLNVFQESIISDSKFESVSFGSGPPMAINGRQLGTTFRLPHQTEVEGFHAEMKIGDPKYLDFFGLELIAGRNFRENKRGFDEFIVNETVLENLNWTAEEALGKKLRINEGEATIVGVIKNFHNNSLQREITPVILMNWDYFQDFAFIKSAGSNAAQLIKLEEIWKATFPTSIYSYGFLDDSIEREYALEQLILKGFSVFSILVIIIGSLGLFGLMSFITLRKTKEVGIRKVLGASISQIVLFFSKEFIYLIALAFLVATPIAYYFMDAWLQDFVYRIDLSIWMFAIGGALTLTVAGMASFFQIAKAVTINPVETLSSE